MCVPITTYIRQFFHVSPWFLSDVSPQHPPSHDLCCEVQLSFLPAVALWSPRMCWPCHAPAGSSSAPLAHGPVLLAVWWCAPPAVQSSSAQSASNFTLSYHRTTERSSVCMLGSAACICVCLCMWSVSVCLSEYKSQITFSQIFLKWKWQYLN